MAPFIEASIQEGALAGTDMHCPLEPHIEGEGVS